jgi:hypothetical protein
MEIIGVNLEIVFSALSPQQTIFFVGKDGWKDTVTKIDKSSIPKMIRIWTEDFGEPKIKWGEREVLLHWGQQSISNSE